MLRSPGGNPPSLGSTRVIVSSEITSFHGVRGSVKPLSYSPSTISTVLTKRPILFMNVLIMDLPLILSTISSHDTIFRNTPDTSPQIF